MKKIILVLVGLIILTGCDKKENLKCQVESNFVGEKILTVVDVKIKNKKVTTATMTMSSDSKDAIKSLCSAYNITSDNDKVECKEKEIILSDFDKMINEDGLTKAQILDYFADNGYTCK